MIVILSSFSFFFFNDTATTEIYTLSLHDALPICRCAWTSARNSRQRTARDGGPRRRAPRRDRKSTRLNSSHGYISYAVFCLKKKKKTTNQASKSKPLISRTSRVSPPLAICSILEW